MDPTPMKRDQALTLLRSNQASLKRNFGIQRISLFGSVARDQASESSDIDVLVAFNEPTTFDRYMGLKYRLEEILRQPVDLVTEAGLKPRARDHVERDAILVA
jgi:predicted nucleotidyltransferase